MPYIGRNHIAGDHTSNFKVLDDISSYTATFNGSSALIISTADNTIRIPEHRFIQGQRVTYSNGGGGNIGGLTNGTAYFVTFDTANTFKLATSLANANNNTNINLSSVGSGSSHTLTAAFDGVNTTFKITHGGGSSADIVNSAQLQIAINNVIQKANLDSTYTEGFLVVDSRKIQFKTAPTANDIFWGNIIANTIETFDIADLKVDNFTGDGTTTQFTLSRSVPNNESIMVTIDGVLQHPSDKDTTRAYRVLSESVIEFSSPPPNHGNIQVRHLGFAGASTGDVTGFYGRTGNVVLGASDHITTGDITPRNINASGIVTASSFVGNLTGNVSGNLTVGGVLTYEDVTNVDSIGIITARSDIHVGAGVSAVGVGTFGSLDIGGDIDVDGHTNLDNLSVAGVSTFTGLIDCNGGARIDNIKLGVDTNEEISTQVGNLVLDSATGTVNVTDNLVVTGDLDVDGHTNLDNVSIAGIVTATAFHGSGAALTGIDATAIKDSGGNVKIQAQASGAIHSGISTFNEIKLGDNNKIKIGGGGDGYELYHDTTASYIKESGTGNLRILASNLRLADSNNNQYAFFYAGGAAELNFAGNKKFETTNTGAVVTGILTATSFSGDGSALTGITQTTINNNGSNRIITGSGTANTLEGESTFTYDGLNKAKIDTNQTYAMLQLDGSSSGGGAIEFYADGTRKYELYGIDAEVALYDREKGAYHTKFKSGGNIELSDGNLLINTSTSAAGNLVVKSADSSSNQVWIVGRSSDNTASVSFRNNADNAYTGRIEVEDTNGMIFQVGSSDRIQIKPNGQTILGNVSNTSGNTNSALHIESGGMNVETGYDTDDTSGDGPHLTLSGQSTRVRMDFGTMNVGPYAGFIQARYDNHPFGNSGTDDGLEPLCLNPRGGVLAYNVHDSTAISNVGGGNISPYGGFILRAGRANSTTVNNNSTAIKIYPAEVRAYSGSGGIGEQNQGTKYGGIAWHGLDPHNGSWNGYGGHHCWMGMSYHSTPGQEFSNWQVQMNNNSSSGSYATNVAVQASPQGYVTHPNQPCISVGLNRSDTNIGNGSDLFQTYSSAMFYDVNQGNIAFDSSNGRWTIPINGNYMVSFYSIKNGSNVQGYVDIVTNGGNGNFLRAYSSNSTNGWSTYSAFGIKTLSKGDYINVKCPGSPANWNAHGAQHMRFVIALYS